MRTVCELRNPEARRPSKSRGGRCAAHRASSAGQWDAKTYCKELRSRTVDKNVAPGSTVVQQPTSLNMPSAYSVKHKYLKTRHFAEYATICPIGRGSGSYHQSRLAGDSKDTTDHQWVEKLPTPVFQGITTEVVSLLDEHLKNTKLRHPWSLLRDSLHACHLYISRRAVLIRPLIPPSCTHLPFSGAKQRLYMSATLGAGGDLERVTGRQPIHKIPVPLGWDKQGIGRRFFLFRSDRLTRVRPTAS